VYLIVPIENIVCINCKASLTMITPVFRVIYNEWSRGEVRSDHDI